MNVLVQLFNLREEERYDLIWNKKKWSIYLVVCNTDPTKFNTQ